MINKGYAKISYIALLTCSFLAAYTLLSSLITPTEDVNEIVIVESDTTYSPIVVAQNDKVAPKPKKKKYVKKIKRVTFDDVKGGDNFARISTFYEALEKLESGSIDKVRIAYFGDSITESDLCSAAFRKSLQKRFGGEGVGFVPAVSKLSKYRSSIKHTYTSNWKVYRLRKKSQRDFPLGICGNVSKPMVPKEDSLGYVASTICSHTYKKSAKNRLPNSTLIIKNEKEPLNITYILDKKDTLNAVIEVKEGIQFVTLVDSMIDELTISYFPKDTCYVYGLDFSGDKGIYVDNYSIRGNKGNNFVHIKSDIIESFYEKYNYDLTILHYGANVTVPTARDYGWYRISMKKNIKYLKSIEKMSPIILFGMGDRGALVDTLWVSSPDIPYLIKEQKRIAKDREAGFWNIFSSLGGENINVSLREKGYLIKDHTHFSRKGAKFFGELTYSKFMEEFKKFQGE